MVTVVLTPSNDPDLWFVKKTIEGGIPDTRNPKYADAPNNVTGIDSNGEYTWVREGEGYRPYLYNDRFAGLTQQQKKDVGKSFMDNFYWAKVGEAENPFFLGNPIANPDAEDLSVTVAAIRQVTVERRLYLTETPVAEIDAVLAVVIPFYQAMKDAYPTVWSDVKQQVIQLDEIPLHPSWPSVPAFLNIPDEDAPSVPVGTPPPI